jgi:hypothetical protein
METIGAKEPNLIQMKVLKLFFDAGRNLSIDEVASSLSMDIYTIQYHFDLLLQCDLLVQTRGGFESAWVERDHPDMYGLTPRGRECIAENAI